MRKELHILVGCADARDLNQIQVECIQNQLRDYNQRGIATEFHVIRAAGSFISHDVYNDIVRIILDHQQRTYEPESTTSYFIHITTHGQLTETSDRNYVSEVYRMKVVEGSILNCGMLGASGVGIEIEELLLENQPVLHSKSGPVHIKSLQDIRHLLLESYAYDGYLAGDWLKSIDYLRTHPRAQRAQLEKWIHFDPQLKRLDIQVTAGIQDYSIHALVRVDGGLPQVPFWDDAQQEIRKKVKLQPELVDAQTARQMPVAALLNMTDTRSGSRMLAAQYYMREVRGETCPSRTYFPNLLFNMSGSSFDMPNIPFGPYAIGGMYFALRHLGISDVMVAGAHAGQTLRMMAKINLDPLMNYILKEMKARLIPLSVDELSAVPITMRN